ncbi:MAG: hypothetical protein FWD57_09410 [Polyangiaceae bacterium]|nr:hypothetical protein [Polyangiaceae bacterium]
MDSLVDVIQLTLNYALTICLTYGLVRFDRSRIPKEWRQRGWNEASTAAAISTFAPFCVIAHFWVTRRSARGIAMGFASLLLLIVAQVIGAMIIELLLRLFV